jgi:hypothetical protein
VLVDEPADRVAVLGEGLRRLHAAIVA